MRGCRVAIFMTNGHGIGYRARKRFGPYDPGSTVLNLFRNYLQFYHVIPIIFISNNFKKGYPNQELI